MGLTLYEYELLNIIEQDYLRSRKFPTIEELQSRFGDKAEWLNKDFWDSCCQNALWLKGLINRGLDAAFEFYGLEVPADQPIGRVKPAGLKGVLSGLQLELVSLILDPHDKRTIESKCRSLGITSKTYQSWLKEDHFREYINNRAETLFGDHLPEVHTALHKKALTGDVPAVKLVYELTGYYTERPDKDFDPRWVIAQVLEVLQQELPPELLEHVAGKLAMRIGLDGRAARPVIEANTIENFDIPVGRTSVVNF